MCRRRSAVQAHGVCRRRTRRVRTTTSDRSKAREVSPIQMAAMIYYNRGVDLLAEKRFAEAAAANAKALRLDPANATARGNLLATINNWSIELGRLPALRRGGGPVAARAGHGRQVRGLRPKLRPRPSPMGRASVPAGRFEEAMHSLAGRGRNARPRLSPPSPEAKYASVGRRASFSPPGQIRPTPSTAVRQ